MILEAEIQSLGALADLLKLTQPALTGHLPAA